MYSPRAISTICYQRTYLVSYVNMSKEYYYLRYFRFLYNMCITSESFEFDLTNNSEGPILCTFELTRNSSQEKYMKETLV
jgi:hypothetical protein